MDAPGPSLYLASDAIFADPSLFSTNQQDDNVSEADSGRELTEQQLRRLYDDDEIERFLNLFSAYVTEVRLPETPKPGTHYENPLTRVTSNEVPGTEGPWTDTPGSSRPPIPAAAPHDQPNRTLSELIAIRYLLPVLPPAPPPAPPFSLGRFRLTTQRLYLSIQPAYVPFLQRLTRLATWKDKDQSLKYCAIFWVLWYNNLLLPALIFRILYAMIRRRVFSYPTLEELREHRREIERANEFGAEMSSRVSATSSSGLKEMWRLFKVANKSAKTKSKASAKEKLNGASSDMPPEDAINPTEIAGDATVLDDSMNGEEARDLKRIALHALSEVADLHERIKNIFIWRRPASSRIYVAAMFLIFAITLVLPAKYLAKLTYFVGGVLFWHVVPVIAALPRDERSRLPPAFGDVPTDAEYALELISQRVAAGLDVRPKKKHGKSKSEQMGNRDTVAFQNMDSDMANNRDGPSEGRDKKVDWKKWGERAATAQNWAEDGKRLISGGPFPQDPSWPPRSPVVPQPAVAVGRPEVPVETHTFPAQHSSTPGLITISPTTLYFTPVMSTTAKFVIPLADLRGARKTGLLKGLCIRWMMTDPQSGEKFEQEEKFKWVGGRDELFARLIGPDGRRWMTV